ncbi:alpha/beta hydrolase [Amycolatopsis pithecellobii]|uniref:Alpha/beta fold hydrolase n=1 Tax=Amycolatopsis pithecellobii TaxID=664692 RepID=A0A6N7Z9K6_9PSEU|nr:alpha/beta hydrolase [Amycolatopsis pithecellobii]MTD58414.1 alpha/beta fold hydrolase [Amycolatopsis pithecellobii]
MLAASTAHGASIPEVTHHHVTLAGTDLHYVTAGDAGTPILLVHGFPESWWAFRKLIPLLAAEHRVIAVDLPGFGDSDTKPGEYTSSVFADTLRALLVRLDLGPVHLTGQDISGIATVRLATGTPELVRSFAAIETALPGYGLERFADVANGGMWHIGFLGAPGIPEMLLTGRERAFLTGFALPAMCGTEGAITEADVDEFTRVYSRPDGLRGTVGIYGSMLTEGHELKGLLTDRPLTMPVLAVDAGSGDFTSTTMHQVAANVTTVTLDGVGHLVAQEAPEALAAALLDFYRPLDA